MVKQLRVVDLAKTMGISPAELIFKLKSIGVNVDTEEDALDFSTVRAIMTGETLQKRPREVIVRSEAAEEKESTTGSAKDRLARRKRRRIIKTEREIAEVAPSPRKETPPAEEEAPAAETADRSAIITPSCAEHGIASDSRAITMILSLRVSRILLERTAMVTHPNPSTIGRVALPFTPTTFRALFVNTVSRGKYPVSSRIPNIRKKITTIGRTIETA
jgi:hypothetical protein